MIERNYEIDLQGLFNDADRIKNKIAKQCQSIYQSENLAFSKQCYRSVEGDVYAKVLGLYLQRVLNQKPAYEKKLIGRMRADIQFTDEIPKVIIEVKSHGAFSYKDLEKRFKKLTDNMPNSRHLYVAFRERKDDYVPKTQALLQQFKVETFFLSTYETDEKVTKQYPEVLRKLVETIATTI